MEIGSEFYTGSTNIGINNYKQLIDYPYRYVLSGRTGLNLVAEEIKFKSRSRHIFIPSYCCGSMVAPFVNNGFNIFFYDPFSLQQIDIENMIDVVLIMDYFGFVSEKTVCFAKKCKDMGKTIIVDATQSAFSFSKTYELADYIIVSYRKWFDCLCGIVYSKDDFITKEYNLKNSCYVEYWRQASKLKEQYIKDSYGEKQLFLSLYAEANKLLQSNYIGFVASEQEVSIVSQIDSSFLRERRRNNAKVLIDGVKYLSNKYDIKLMYSKLKLEDCPLFVPIILREKNFVRMHLSKNNIYCPCHWPVDYKFPFKETFYHENELSLICDQRYNEEDMKLQLLILSDALELLHNKIKQGDRL